jgi:hypothetical protein
VLLPRAAVHGETARRHSLVSRRIRHGVPAIQWCVIEHGAKSSRLSDTVCVQLCPSFCAGELEDDKCAWFGNPWSKQLDSCVWVCASFASYICLFVCLLQPVGTSRPYVISQLACILKSASPIMPKQLCKASYIPWGLNLYSILIIRQRILILTRFIFCTSTHTLQPCM